MFGRGCYGGGGFACNEALKEIVSERKSRQLSIAIFAPGWTHETRPRNNALQTVYNWFTNGLQTEDQFVDGSFSEREHKFWKLLQNFLNFRGTNLSEKDANKNINQLFSTTFNSGSGLVKNVIPECYNASTKNVQNVSWFLELNAQDSLPVLFSHPSPSVLNYDQSERDENEHFNIYLSNDSLQNINSQNHHKGTPDQNQAIQPNHLLVLENNRVKGNWIFCNRSSSIPLFLNEITTEKPNMLFQLEYTMITQEKGVPKPTDEIGSFLRKPHLIVRYSKRKNKDLASTLKLCPYSNNTRCCFHKSYDDAKEKNVHGVINKIMTASTENTDFEHIQYVLSVEALKSKNVSKAVSISAILIEAPMAQQKMAINKFVIYEA